MPQPPKDIPEPKSTPPYKAPSTRRIPRRSRLTTQSLLDALAQTVPLSTTRAEEIEALRDWARTRAVPASVPGRESVQPR